VDRENSAGREKVLLLKESSPLPIDQYLPPHGNGKAHLPVTASAP